MAWTATQFFTALAAEWQTKALRGTEQRTHMDVNPVQGLPGAGLSNRDMRYHTLSGTADRIDSTLVIQEVAEFYKSWSTQVTEEAFEDYLAVSAGEWWWATFEVVSNPAQAATVSLRWLEPDGGSPTKAASVSVTPGGTAALTATALLTALETIPHNASASRRVVNGRGALFHAWVTTGGSSGNSTVVVAASSHRQTFARATTAFSSSDVLIGYAYGASDGALLTNKIRDLRSPWSTAMGASEIEAIAMANAASGTTSAIPTREDVDVQEALFRPGLGASMHTAGKVVHNEIIAPAVQRACIIEIDYSDFSGATGALSRSIALPFPFTDRLGFDYYSEGPPIIVDAFVEHHTSFQVDSGSAQAGVYPSVELDIGMSNPVLFGGTGRVSKSAILRGCRMTRNVTQGYPPEAGMEPVNRLHSASETYHGAVIAEPSAGASEWFAWGETSTFPAADYLGGGGNAIPPHITMAEHFVLTSLTFEMPSGTAYTKTGSNYVTMELYVCPKDTDPQTSGFVLLSSYVDLTAAPYNNANWPTAKFTPASMAASKLATEVISLLIPAGWKLAIKLTKYGTAIGRGVTCRAVGHTHRGKGELLLSSTSTAVVDPWSDRSDTLTATLSLEAKVDLQVGSGITEPQATTYNLASLDQGKCFLHVIFWQPRRSAAAQAMTYAASNP